LSDADKLGDDHSGVCHQEREHDQSRPPHTELLANKVRKALARHDSHSHAHLLDDDQTDDHRMKTQSSE
jgi:hypothetical protein